MHQYNHMFPLSQKSNLYKSRVYQGRAGIERKILQKFPIPQAREKPQQTKLLQGRRPIIQMAERPILQSLKSCNST